MNPLVIHALRQCYYVSAEPFSVKKFNFSGNFLRVPQKDNNAPVGEIICSGGNNLILTRRGFG
jgi:hypothetical protein